MEVKTGQLYFYWKLCGLAFFEAFQDYESLEIWIYKYTSCYEYYHLCTFKCVLAPKEALSLSEIMYS